MFEHVVLRRAEHGSPITVGDIVEALLYYQRVHIVIDRSTLLGLLKQIGPNHVILLLQRADISAVYCEEMLAIYTNGVGALQVHMPVAIAFQGHEKTGPLRTPEERLIYDIEQLPLDKRAAHHFAKQFLRRVPVRKFSGSHFIQGGVPEAVKKDIMEPYFLKKAVRHVISQMPGGFDLDENFKFDVVDTDLGFYVFHDIDLAAINARRAAAMPSAEPITVAHLLGCIQDARADLVLASSYGGDFITSQAVSAVIKIRHKEILRRTDLNAEARSQFVEIVLPDLPTLKEVVDAGERSLKEALILVDRAARFKEWLKSVNPDEGLVRVYMRDISSEGWVQRLPAKSLRYVLTLALDSANPVAGLLAGFADNFIIEKLLAGWRPNHFVSSRLEPFFKGNS